MALSEALGVGMGGGLVSHCLAQGLMDFWQDVIVFCIMSILAQRICNFVLLICENRKEI